jgi:hemoglobin/transferrin/lactoferrin receptor protein
MEFGDHRVMAGVDVWERQLRNSFRYRTLNTGKVLEDQPLPRADYLSAGVFAEDDWRIGSRLVLNLGARVDYIHVQNDANDLWEARKEDEASWNAHAGATYDLTEALSANLIIAHGYRAASIEERYKYLNLGSVEVWGDPELDPEQSTFGEAGLRWVDEDLSCSVAAFYNRLHDLIAETVVDASTRQMANIDQAEIYGVEAEGRYYIVRDWQLYANIAWADGRDTRNHEYLPNVAPLNGLAGIRYEAEKGLWGYLETVWAARQDHTPEGIESVAGWQTVNCRIGYDLEFSHSSHRLFAGVDNIFDETYQDYLTTSRGFVFNEPGRSFVGGYEVEF